MRPKFSLRHTLIFVAIVAVALYVFVDRPTQLANKFIAAVANKDFATARALMVDAADWERILNPPQSFPPDNIYAELMPRDWQDLSSFRRRIVLRVSRHNNHPGRYIDWTEDSEIFAGIRGLELDASNNFKLAFPTVHAPQPPVVIPRIAPKLEPNPPTS